MNDTWWGTQPEMFGPRNAHRLGLLFQALDAIPVPSRVLDAAVGLGDVAERLRQRGHWVAGVDLSIEAALLARGRTGAHIVVANLTALPFRSDVLDVVISSETLEHIEDDLVALREFSRVLHTRGQSVVTVPAIEKLRTFSDDYYQHLRRYSRPALVALFRDAGFRVVFAHYWGFPFVLLYDYLFMVPLNKRRAKRGVDADSMLRGVRSAGRMRWLVRVVSGLFAADRLWPRMPFGVGIILSAVKLPGDGTVMPKDNFATELGKICEDLRGATLTNILAQPGYWAVINFRVAAALTKNRLLFPFYLCYAPIWRIVSLITGIEISPKANIGAGLRIVHFGQVFISAGTTIGKRCLLLNNVTIGTARFDDNSGPQIGDDVRVGVGARILGRIALGDRCEVGANALVTRSFPADSVILGAPGTSIGLRQNSDVD